MIIDKKEHIKRHKMLHRYFDELVADYVNHTNEFLAGASIMDLMEWSSKQTKCPDVKFPDINSGCLTIN